MFKYSDLRSKSRVRNRRASKPQHSAHEGAIVDHVARFLARPAFVIHEIESHLVHLDVHVVAPTPEHNFWFLFTTGMSTRPMRRPHGLPGSPLAELSIFLPPDWQMDRDAWRHDSRWFWPIRELKEAALLPHRHHTWLGFGHTVTSADIALSGMTQSLDPSTRLSSMLVTASDLLPDEIDTVAVGDCVVDLMTLIPIYPEELQYAANHGSQALLDELNAGGISDIVDPVRPSVIATSAAS